MSFFAKEVHGFRIGRLSFYKIQFLNGGKPELFYEKANCGCLILDLWYFGATWLVGDCYEYAKEATDG